MRIFFAGTADHIKMRCRPPLGRAGHRTGRAGGPGEGNGRERAACGPPASDRQSESQRHSGAGSVMPLQGSLLGAVMTFGRSFLCLLCVVSKKFCFFTFFCYNKCVLPLVCENGRLSGRTDAAPRDARRPLSLRSKFTPLNPTFRKRYSRAGTTKRKQNGGHAHSPAAHDNVAADHGVDADSGTL